MSVSSTNGRNAWKNIQAMEVTIDSNKPSNDMGAIKTTSGLCRSAWQCIYDSEFERALNLCDRIETSAALIPEYFRNRIAKSFYSLYSIKGIVFFQRGNLEVAVAMLAEAKKHLAHTNQILAFGPNLLLPNLLLIEGETDAVVEFLVSCKNFWPSGQNQIEKWVEAIAKGDRPKLEAAVY